MKIKNKILLTILPVLIIGIVLLNISFGLFFRGFILQSEGERIYVSADAISTYLDGKLAAYAGTVNDWAHWDDTYYFVENSNKDYVDLNLSNSALAAIDVNFMIFLNSDDFIIHQLFYDYEEESITEIPPDLLENNTEAINFSRIGEDTSGIIKIGNSYYFIASSLITDSIEEENPNGTLIIGRQIDRYVISLLEKSSGFTITDINVLNDISRLNDADDSNVLEIDYNAADHNSINLEVAVPNAYDVNSSVVISMIMRRDLYVRGMQQALDFSFFNTFASLVISFIIFLLVGKFITIPFTSLMNDVKSIDITKPDIHTIPESGNDEFSFLRKSINGLMNRIVASQNQLIKSREEFHTTLLSIGEGVITVDINSQVKFMNPTAQKMTGWNLEESLNKQLDTVLTLIDEAGKESAVSPADAVFKTKGMIKRPNDLLLKTKEGEVLDIKLTATPIKELDGEISGCVIAIDDITDTKRNQRHIEYLSYRDILTGLYNRRFYEEKVKEYEMKENFPISVILIDVNGLKLTNDAFGHETGDRLLIKVAEFIEKKFRSEDIVCRIGGDEFVILLPNADVEEATQIMKRMHKAVENENIENIPISISCGWSAKQQNSEKMETVFRRAEDMMYQNKSADNNSQRHKTIQVIMKTLFEKSPREEAHSKRVSEVCLRIGEQMGLDFSSIKNLQTAGLLHDIGKIGVSSTILEKAGPLTEDEWMEIKKHPQTSYNIVSSVNEYGPLADIILSHHERWDGTGYPNGLAGEEIRLESRIIALADAYDAMVSDRPYRKGMGESTALEIIESEAGKQFDPAIVRIFLGKVMKKS